MAASPALRDSIANNLPSTSAEENPTPEELLNPTFSDGNSTFAACLLVMDDNNRLVEWMAYHYHTLPLRHLIVAVDPRSRTSPTQVLNRYRRMGVYIEQWSDHDFMDARLADSVLPDTARFQLKRDRHRSRQKVFYRSCMIKLKEQGRTFVTLHDTDEYLVYNHAGGENFQAYESRMQAIHGRSRNKHKMRNKPLSTPPTTAEEKALLPYMLKERAGGNPYFQGSCLSVPRLHYGAVESTRAEQENLVPPSFALQANQFDTFRWRKHSKRNDFVRNNLAKVIIDVSRVDMAATARFRSLHRPIPSICQAPWVSNLQ